LVSGFVHLQETGKLVRYPVVGCSIARDGGKRRGQAMIEYIIALVVVLTLTGLLTLMLYAIRQNGDRVLDLVASEYP